MIITEGTNFLKENERNRLNLDLKIKQVNFLDQRVYTRGKDIYYPSVTSILQYMPKGKFFETWLKENGSEADHIMRKAGREGTQTHAIIEQLIKGEEVEWMDDKGAARYSELVWQMAMRFVDFWKQMKPELIALEDFVFSDSLQYAGTADFICKIQDETWLIDFKTSNALYRTYDMQLASYAKAWEEMGNGKIDRTGILWLKSPKRKESTKDGVYQGKNWELKPIDDIQENFDLFLTIYKLYKLDNPKVEPVYRQYPTVLKL
jgi:hypothetical protein